MNYRIICTRKEWSRYAAHTHIAQVGTGTTSRTYDRLWTVREVIAAMANGDHFYTQGPDGKVAWVDTYECCGGTWIRTRPDQSYMNNLDSLPSCS